MRRSALCWALCAALSPPGPAQRRARQRPTPSADQSAAPAVEPTPPLDVAWSADAGGWSADAAEFGWTAEDAADSGWTADLDSLPASVPFGAEMGFGETQQVEFKSCAHGNALGVIKDKVGRYIVALANTAGGVIIFGIEDDGIVSGVPLDREDKAQVTRLVDGATQRVDPQLDCHAVKHAFVPVDGGPASAGGKFLYLVVVGVRRGLREPVYYVSAESGECYLRRTESVFAISRELQLRRELDFKGSGSPATRTWRHVASRSLEFSEHMKSLKSGAGSSKANRRWFWKELGRWFDSEAEAKGRLVVVLGRPGSGKSTLMAALVDGARRGNSQNIAVMGHHFCMAHAPETISVELFVHNFAASLVSLASFKRCVALPHARELLRVTEQPDKIAAMRSLLSLCDGLEPQPNQKTAFVVDGLDEAEINSDGAGGASDGAPASADSPRLPRKHKRPPFPAVLTIPRLLAETAGDAPSWLVFVVTTRPSPRSDVLSAPRQTISLDGALSTLDVAEYARRRLRAAPAVKGEEDEAEAIAGDAARFDSLALRLGEASKGSFQFARAVLDLIAESAFAPEAVAQLLDSAPGSHAPLEGLYDAIFAAKFPPARHRNEWEFGCRPVLELLLASPRALAADDVDEALLPFFPQLNARRFLHGFLRPLVILSAPAQGASVGGASVGASQEAPRVKMNLHLTFRQWLLRPGHFSCSAERGHAYMAVRHLGAVRSLNMRGHFGLLGDGPARNDEVVFHVLEAAQHLACAPGQVSDAAETMRSLAGPALRTEDGQGRTAVHFAAKHSTKRVEALKLLLEAVEGQGDARGQGLESRGFTSAASRGRRLVARRGAAPARPRRRAPPALLPMALQRTRDGKTPLVLAASRGRADAVAALVESAAKMVARGECAPAALVDAAMAAARAAAGAGSVRCMRILLARGAKVQRRDLDDEVAVWLERCLLLGAADAADAAVPTPRFDASGRSALMVAVRREATESVLALLRARRGDQLDACLFVAAGRGNADLVEVLLRHGADAGARHADGAAAPGALTPLMAAAAAGHAGCVRRLLRSPRGLCSAACADSEGRSALHQAVFHLRVDCVHELLRADAPAMDRGGATPLHTAVYWTRGRRNAPAANARGLRILDLVLATAATAVDARDAAGRMALDLACTADGDQLVWIDRLIKAGARVCASQIEAALQRGNVRCAGRLRRALDGAASAPAAPRAGAGEPSRPRNGARAAPELRGTAAVHAAAAVHSSVSLRQGRIRIRAAPSGHGGLRPAEARAFRPLMPRNETADR